MRCSLARASARGALTGSSAALSRLANALSSLGPWGAIRLTVTAPGAFACFGAYCTMHSTTQKQNFCVFEPHRTLPKPTHRRCTVQGERESYLQSCTRDMDLICAAPRQTVIIKSDIEQHANTTRYIIQCSAYNSQEGHVPPKLQLGIRCIILAVKCWNNIRVQCCFQHAGTRCNPALSPTWAVQFVCTRD